MALKKVKGNIERMFDKNLTDLVRGIRNNKENEASWTLGYVNRTCSLDSNFGVSHSTIRFRHILRL
ncbi:unnamed protein product [Acanthoscelides obtectus]|uniref:Uncharacterized protein n=1 Tax=Acanthoscelides obtectus TaxID=200917 RepID=A0A9P0LZG2_ACAOB|nr:unnamed protein product [Acanthoscelides obtectus]CAK1659254.1 AP-3 complex subunit delta [Acanthoscelides obtectus]